MGLISFEPVYLAQYIPVALVIQHYVGSNFAFVNSEGIDNISYLLIYACVVNIITVNCMYALCIPVSESQSVLCIYIHIPVYNYIIILA